MSNLFFRRLLIYEKTCSRFRSVVRLGRDGLTGGVFIVHAHGHECLDAQLQGCHSNTAPAGTSPRPPNGPSRTPYYAPRSPSRTPRTPAHPPLHPPHLSPRIARPTRY